MRVLYVCSDFGIPPGGTKGASVHLRAITRALAALGHEVYLLSPKGRPGSGHPARCLELENASSVERTCKGLKHWLARRSLDGAVARELRPLLYNEWAERHAPALVAAVKPDVIVERLSLLGHVGVDLADALGLPLVVEVNAPISTEASTFRSLRLRPLADEVEHRVLTRADAVITVSRTLADLLARRGIPRPRLHVIPNGVDAEAFEPSPAPAAFREEHDLTDAFVVGFVGSLKPWHGVHVLLEAFDRLQTTTPSARLLIVGDGPEQAALEAASLRKGLESKIVFTGAVPHERTAAIIQSMDVGVAPFLEQTDFYFSPIKVFEYMAAGCCVVASDLGQIAELIEDGETGMLCAAGDAAALADCLKAVYASADLRTRLGSAARELVLDRYTWGHAAARTVQAIGAAQRSRSASRGGTPSPRPTVAETGVRDEKNA